jgi:transcriptional regulator with XRE-family HTH domain
MGDVIKDYSFKRGFYSQDALADATGYTKRTIDYWENTMYLAEMERRIFLAKLLRIPPALLGLTVYSVMDDTYAIENYTDSLKRMTELAEEDSYYAYEDILVLGWECLRKGSIPQVAERVNRRLQKLQEIVQTCPVEEREAWLVLLCQYYRLSSAFSRHTLPSEGVQSISTAISLAEELDDVELIATSYQHRAHRYVSLNQIKDAKHDIDVALTYANRVRPPLKGNIYLRAIEINSYLGGSTAIREENKRLHGLAANLAYDLKETNTYDRTFQVLNTSSVHHERAKTFIKLYEFDPKAQYLKDAENELNLVRKSFSPELVEWQLFFALTEGRLRIAQGEITESAIVGKEALKTARLLASQSGIADVTTLYLDLEKYHPNNLEVINLGVQLGRF